MQEQTSNVPFDSRIKYRERLGREEFFYLTFRALSFNQIDGDYVEFGSHGATTFCLAYHQAALHRHKAKLWAFDSFQGFPDQVGDQDYHPKWIKGRMSTSLEDFHRLCKSRGVPQSAYTVHAGFFSDVLPNLPADEAPDNIALAYIDCDLYSSTMDVLEFLTPRFKHGMIIAFDDYYCWSDKQPSGERLAMMECFGNLDRWELIPHLQFGWHGLSFVLHDKALNTASWQPNL
ncbi:MAG: TylF/MycF/NovP-related O-methyltransferase [Rhizobiaceae bacterium]